MEDIGVSLAYSDIPYSAEKFSDDKWISATTSMKIEALQGFENKLAKEQDRKPRIVRETTESHSFYNDENQDFININITKINKSNCSESAFDVAHENEHTFQWDAVNGRLSDEALEKAYKKYGGKKNFEKLVEDWRTNFKAYYDPSSQYVDYNPDIEYIDENGEKEVVTFRDQNWHGYGGGYGFHYTFQDVERGANISARQALQKLSDDLDSRGIGSDYLKEYIADKKSENIFLKDDAEKYFGPDPEQRMRNELLVRSKTICKQDDERPNKSHPPKWEQTRWTIQPALTKTQDEDPGFDRDDR